MEKRQKYDFSYSCLYFVWFFKLIDRRAMNLCVSMLSSVSSGKAIVFESKS